MTKCSVDFEVEYTTIEIRKLPREMRKISFYRVRNKNYNRKKFIPKLSLLFEIDRVTIFYGFNSNILCQEYCSTNIIF